MNGKEEREKILVETKIMLKLQLMKKIISEIKQGEKIEFNLTAEDPTIIW